MSAFLANLFNWGAAGAPNWFTDSAPEKKGGARKPPPGWDGTIIGTAVPRGTPPTVEGADTTGQTAASALANAKASGERARKRAAAGGTVLTTGQMGQAGPGASYKPLTLLGS